MIPSDQVAKFRNAAPFWMSLILVPVAIFAALYGGWTVILLPVVTWYLFSILDAFLGLNLENADLETGEDQLSWYKAITIIWAPVQFALLFWMIWYVTGPGDAHLSPLETIVLFFGVGVITGTVGIVYSHELMHQKDRGERFLGDALLSMVLYSHFRSEHLRVHHPYVGTSRDAVTARYNEGFHRYFLRVLRESPISAFRSEKAMLARKGKHWSAPENPFWRYLGLQAFMLLLALLVGGWTGLLLFLWQAGAAIWQLELVNYVEHYALTRKHLGDGKYEHVKPHHSWNAAHKASNWLLINLQRHSDHHYKPDRRFPLLQNYDESEAPQLPYGYPIMTMAAMIPPVWRRVMNPRVREWRKTYYPEITDWAPYNKARLPMPRGSA
ncbi:alkane 1-monooxygenase [Roseovarius halotolerans]|uniref:Alkane 1-monooxygenase 2 n=1 Tax=Roseovarius halotolerans TaxID=505353 RepID=A0A1X6Z015_9RHOB|nr:alkane 1-monooxygenase [Roseovarius halotolerans]RKT32506.1 alkane 1-monooxygenase [Roseovarius halotolerans]SLN36401.1 Alkane 1-monooxygenase 2 [Roseovarius halotolerans]